MNAEYIHKIEMSLDHLESNRLSDADDAQLWDKLSEFFVHVCNAVEIDYTPPKTGDPRHTCDVLFHENSEPQKKFIAVCLLRLLCRNYNAIWGNTPFRINSVGLFNEQIGSIYNHREININEGDQTHERLDKLAATEDRVLRKFETFDTSIVNLSSPARIRQEFMKTLNSPVSRLFLDQFVPESLTTSSRINEIFTVIQGYDKSNNMEDHFDSFQSVRDSLDPYLTEAGTVLSIFTELCILAPIRKMYDFIQEDFDSNDVMKPADVDIQPSDRKYPFYKKGKKIELKFNVTNRGPGYAFDIEFECHVIEGLALPNRFDNADIADAEPYKVPLGTLKPNEFKEIVLKAAVDTANVDERDGIGILSWSNFKRIDWKTKEVYFDVKPQSSLDWDTLEHNQPYSLKAIKKADDLVGRKSLLKQLRRELGQGEIESSFIFGQKRVGKTSIAEVLKATFEGETDYSVVSVPIIDLDTTTPEDLVANLGTRIVSDVSNTSSLFSHLEKPEFKRSLSPLVDFFRGARGMLPSHRFIIIIDEFDEINPEFTDLDNDIGKNFFQTIRSLSQSEFIGIVLVGGENMEDITGLFQQRLNNLRPHRVDYFNKSPSELDFQELVTHPTQETLEFNDAAINAVYELTEGNPYYTNFLCGEIYTNACQDNNAFISEDMVEQAVQMTVQSLTMGAFSHLWVDKIDLRLDEAKIDEIQTHRRKFLIAYAQFKRRKESITRADLIASPLLEGVDVDRIINEFINRGFLIEDDSTAHLRWRPRLFERWLIDELGFSKLTDGYKNEKAINRLRTEEKEAFVTDREVVDLCDGWGLYQGERVTASHVRAWLNQFKYRTEQRLMFKLLQHVKFYSDSKVREKLVVLHEQVQRVLAELGVSRRGDRRARRSDILVSSFGPPTKSGALYARLYAQANGITSHNAVNFEGISDDLCKDSDNNIRAIVFVDDLIASGDTAIASLNKLNKMCGALIQTKKVKVFVSAICGLDIGDRNLQSAMPTVPFDVEVNICDYLLYSEQCFNNSSQVFNSPDERIKSKGIARNYGIELVKNSPLGYNDCQLLVVFHDNCPNNTLPILWKESTGKTKWMPLFKRN